MAAAAAAGVARGAGDKLAALRALLARNAWAAYVVPTADAHNSEYVAAADARRAYLSGFTGSAGTAVVTAGEARLWTDGRYFLQAEAQLDGGAGWVLMRDRLPETPSVESWLGANVPRGGVVGVDPLTLPQDAYLRLQAAADGSGVKLAAARHANLVDEVWGVERPPVPMGAATVHPEAYAGMAHTTKLAAVRVALAKEHASALVVAGLDEVAWLFNIRGADVECNPVVQAYGIVTDTSATLYINPAKVTPALRMHLGDAVDLQPYDAVFDAVAALPGRVWLDSSSCNAALFAAAAAATAAGASASPAPAPRIVSKLSPIALLKAVKNEAEVAGFRAAHTRDAVALVTFFAWLEAAVTTGVDRRTGAPLAGALTEASASDVLEAFRAAQDKFVGLSFPTIAGMGANGAIIHYRPEPATAATITADGVFLCDSGGQYLDGTTDVTRTLHFGTPTAHQKHAYTRVLQGHIGLGRAVFPEGASGVALDALARSPLWRSGLDYQHGTGHGVGAFLNVHEGPFGAATVARTSYTGGILEGMTLTDEPGYYESGAFGIRIENVMLARRAATPHAFGGRPYLEFEHFTVVPITTRLVDASLLEPAEVAWLNAYNARVRDTLSPLLAAVPWAHDYLLRETAPLA